MDTVLIRRAGGALLHLWSDAAGIGFDVPAGPCEVRVPDWAVALIPDAEIVSEPGDPAEE